MRRRPFLIFASVIGALVAGTLWFIQSPGFAVFVKQAAAKYIPTNLGIDGDFSEFAIKLVPPGISIKNPRATVRKRNVLDLPGGSSVKADRIDLTFRFFQMFSGDIRVKEVAIVNGEVNLLLDPEEIARRAARKSEQKAEQKADEKKGPKAEFHWDELFKIHAESVAARDTVLHVRTTDQSFSIDLLAQTLRLGQWSGRGGIGYEVSADLTAFSGVFPKDLPIPRSLERMQLEAKVNALGLRVDSLSVASEGIDVSCTGEIKGNLLKPKTLTLDASATAKGEIGHTLKLIGPAFSKIDASGLFEFTGNVKGDLERLVDTLKVQGSLNGKDVRFGKWTADQLTLDGDWTAAAAPGELAEVSVNRGMIQAREQQRVGGFQPGGGGKVEIGAFRFTLDKPFRLSQAVTVPLKLERAHLDWLAAPGLKDIYPLSFRVSGAIDAQYEPATDEDPWQIEATLHGLALDEFSLDNQKYGMTKPMSAILKVPKIAVDGSATVDAQGIHPDLAIGLPNSKLKLGGLIDLTRGKPRYALVGGGAIDLRDVGTISGKVIRGTGTLDCHVTGPSSAVMIDFDSEIKNAYYLNLALGDMKGRITWDDSGNRLLFHDVRLRQGATDYQVAGALDLGQKESVALDAKFLQGDIQDIIAVFDELTKGLWWFPRSLSGPVTGTVAVRGGIGLDKLVVMGELTGKEWEYAGERFKAVTAAGGYDRGKYEIEDFESLKRTGHIHGRISFDTDRKFDWDLETNDLAVSDLDHIARLDVPIRGRLEVSSRGSGKEGEIESITETSLTAVAVRGLPMPDSHGTMTTKAGVAEVSGVALGGQGALNLKYGFRPGTSSFVRAEARHLDFTPVLLLLNPGEIQDSALTGYVSGSIDLGFRSEHAERASGHLELSDYVLAKDSSRFQLTHPVSVAVQDGSFRVDEMSLKGKAGTATLSMQSDRGALEGSVVGDLDTSVIEFFTPAISRATGVAALDFAIGGTVVAPSIYGRANLDGASVRVPAVDSPFENVTGAIQLRQNVLSVENLQADLAGGRVGANGTVTLFADRAPTVALKLTVAGSKVKVYPFQFIKISGAVTVKGDQLPYLVEGAVTSDSALSKEKILGRDPSESLKAALYTPPPSTKRVSDYPIFKLNIDAKADHGILIQNDLLSQAEARGHVTIVNTLDTPRIVGSAEIIHGQLVFKDRVFQIQTASATFDNPAVINPSFNLVANTEVNNIKIQLVASGRMDSYTIELSSTPVMGESDILSLLAIGMTSNDAKKIKATDLTAVQQGEAASLLMNSLDFNREMESKTGWQIQIDESVNPLLGTSAFKPQSQVESAAAPKVVIKKRFNESISASAASTLGVGSSSEQDLNLEVRIPKVKGGSVNFVLQNYDDPAIDSNAHQSVGVDLKMEGRFK